MRDLANPSKKICVKEERLNIIYGQKYSTYILTNLLQK